MTTPTIVSRLQNRRGTQAQFDALYPPGYTGIAPFPGDPAEYPNILLPGELALCTDTRKIYIGNLNGEYVEVGVDGSTPVPVPVPAGPPIPEVMELPPAGAWTPISELVFQPTAFLTLPYSITDTLVPDWNTPGNTYSRNGKLEITYASGPNTATLTDTSTEVNTTVFDISFRARAEFGLIIIEYIHNFPTPLQLSTTTCRWHPFDVSLLPAEQ